MAYKWRLNSRGSVLLVSLALFACTQILLGALLLGLRQDVVREKDRLEKDHAWCIAETGLAYGKKEIAEKNTGGTFLYQAPGGGRAEIVITDKGSSTYTISSTGYYGNAKSSMEEDLVFKEKFEIKKRRVR